MKKFYTLIIALSVASVQLMAASDYSGGKRLVRGIPPVMKKDVATGVSRLGQATEIIYNPEGRREYYIKSSVGTFNYLGLIVDYTQPFGAAEVVFGENDEIYLRDIIGEYNPMMYEGGSFVKGKIEEGKIVVDVPQTVSYLTDFGYYLNLYVLKTDDGGDSYYIAEDTSFNYLIKEDGSFSLDLPGEDYAIGFVRSTNDTWAFYSEVKQEYTPNRMTPVTVPENVRTQEYVMTAQGNGYNVKVGFDGDDIYIVGLCDYAPDLAVKGEIRDDKIYIAQDQYLGVYGNWNIVTKCAIKNPDDKSPFDAIPDYLLAPEAGDYVMDIDWEKRIMTSVDPDIYLCLNAALEMVDYIALLQNFTLAPSEDASYSGIPANPFGLTWVTAEDSPFGYDFIEFNLPNISIENTLLNAQNLYYSLYADGEPLLLEEYENEYYGVTEPTYNLPYYFNNNLDILCISETDRIVGIYTELTTIGVKLSYYYQEDVTESEIVTLNVLTGEVTVGEDSGVDVQPDNQIVSKEYFRMDGIKVSDPENGIYIMRTVLSNGKVVTTKVIL